MATIIHYPLRSVSTQLRCHHPLVTFASSTICRSFSTRYKVVTNRNRYDRFRDCIRLAVTNNNNSCDVVFRSSKTDNMAVAKCTMEMLSSNRRSFNRTWDRFNPLIELILHSCKTNKGIKSIADVGCDHGMLAMSLACIAWVNQLGYDSGENNSGENKENQQHLVCDEFLFSNVFGTDVSSQALENGGIASLKRVNEALSKIESLNNNSSSIDLPINFRIGDGLDALCVDEADAVVIAGMGVHTMIDIMYGKAETSSTILSPIDRVQTNYLFLQPTNSRPEHLIILYDCLQKKMGFELCNETVAYVGGRWYINASFCRNDNKQNDTNQYRFPGHYLSNDVFDNYVKHHIQWLKQITQNGPLAEEDRRWLEHISTQDKDEWRRLTTWYSDVHTIID